MNKANFIHIRILFVVVILCVSACSSQQVTQSTSIKPAIPPMPLASIDSIRKIQTPNGDYEKAMPLKQVFALSEKKEKEFLRAYNSRAYSSYAPNRRVFRYLENYLNNFNFYSDTLVAEDALDKNLGNCLSLAILTKALADKVGVKVGYELVSTTPVYQREGEITLSSQHVRTILYGQAMDASSKNYILGPNNLVVDYFPSRGSRRLRQVTEGEFYSMFYRNRAAEALIDNNLLQAYINAQKALEYAPQEAQAINLMAVIHQRVGLKEFASLIYEYAFQYGQESLELLSNYHSFLISEGRLAEAEQIKQKLDKYDDLNPYVWVDLGNTAYDNKDYYQAIRHYRKANKLADYIHEPFLGMAKSYFKLGQLKTAKYVLKKAIDLAHKNETRSIYQQKYELLNKYAHQ